MRTATKAIQLHNWMHQCFVSNSRKPRSLCTVAINPVNLLSRQFAENQHSLCQLAQWNMSAGILDVQSLLVFLFAQQWQKLQSRIPVTFEAVRIDTLSVATETSLPASLPFLGPTRMQVCACSCAQVHLNKSNTALTRSCEPQCDHLYHRLPLEALTPHPSARTPPPPPV